MSHAARKVRPPGPAPSQRHGGPCGRVRGRHASDSGCAPVKSSGAPPRTPDGRFPASFGHYERCPARLTSGARPHAASAVPKNTLARRRKAWHARPGGALVAAKFDFSHCFAYHNEIWDASPGKRPDRPAGGPPRPTGVTRRVGAPTLSKVCARGAPRPPGGAPAAGGPPAGGPPAQSICACRGRPRYQHASIPLTIYFLFLCSCCDVFSII